jgi:hypothetical protein
MVFQNHPPPRVMILFQWTPPPQKKKNRLPPQGGSGIPLSLKQNHFFHIFAIFACFSMCSSEAVSGQTKTDFKNPREVFSQHGLKNKNLSHFLQRSYEQRESKLSFSLFFPFSIYLLQSRSCRSCYGQLGTNLVKPKEVFVQNMPIYNNLLHFSPRCHRSREKHVCSDPFFAENRSVFHGRQLQILWEWWLFLAEAVKPTSETYWDGLSYLFRGF